MKTTRILTPILLAFLATMPASAVKQPTLLSKERESSRSGAVSGDQEQEVNLDSLNLEKYLVKHGESLELNLLTLSGGVPRPSIHFQDRCAYGWQDRKGISRLGFFFTFPPDETDRQSFLEFLTKWNQEHPGGEFREQPEFGYEILASYGNHPAQNTPAIVAIIKVSQLGDKREYIWRAETVLRTISAKTASTHAKTQLTAPWCYD